MTRILSLTLAPPRIAANGRSGASSNLESIDSSRSISNPAYAGSSFGTPTVDACARCADPNASFT